MNTTEANNTEIMEIMQTLMNEGTKGFPSVVAKMYNLAMQFERELHLGAGRYERTEERSGYANGYKPKTLDTASSTATRTGSKSPPKVLILHAAKSVHGLVPLRARVRGRSKRDSLRISVGLLPCPTTRARARGRLCITFEAA